ncbi:MAG: iron complex outerrane recepter protein [Sphingomonadales bacterium]|jgi:outer membrane receptor protein involved in Fe transport|nr:iron complex outerrane recepter protein [Sphingomonadales bacterium]
MRNNPYLSKLLATTIICGAASIATPAFAQDDQPQAGPAEAAQAQEDENDVTVTGTRIPRNLTAVSPVTVVNSEEIRLSGTTRTEDLINSLPQSFAGQGGNLANGASGTATVDLRGLGPDRTLVLINGRRLVPGDPSVPNPDINVIPSTIVSRIDVLTGGASSVYGADAVAGVVNFVMDTNFTGVRLDAQYSFYQHNNRSDTGIQAALDLRGFGYPTGSVADGGTYDLSLAVGAAFDDGRGHVVAYAGYRRLNAVTQGRRDYSACASQARPTAVPASPSPLITCGGSATSANGTVILFDGGTSTFFQVGPNRTLIPGFTPYNFAPTNYYQRPDERYTFGAFANYEISPALQPYLEVMFMDDRTVAQIAPSGDFGNTLSINCGAPGAPTVNAPGVGNPLLSAQQRSLLCDAENLVTSTTVTGYPLVASQSPGAPQVFFDPTTGLPYTRGFAQILRRNVEGGGRRDDLQHTNYRIVAGMRGELSPAWSYDMYYQFAQTNFAETYTNDFSVTRLTRAIDIVDDPRTPGVDPICRSVLNGTDLSCIPYDIFATGQLTPGSPVLNYLQTPGFQRGTNQQTVASASLTGDLSSWGMKFPWAESGVGVAVGVEYRKESLELLTDAAFSLLPSSDLAGQGAPTLATNGSFDVREVFAEVRVPIIEDGFIYNLSLEAGYRYSDYDIGGRGVSTDTYKVGVDLSIIRDIRFRAAYNRAVRAPNIQELFAPQRVVLNGNGDPCAGAAPSAPLAACQAMGVSAAQYGTIAGNPAGQYNGLIGGVPTLNPEIADSVTIGVVLQPSFIPRLAITVDYFDIEVRDAIQNFGQDAILATCVAQPTNAALCGLVHRDSSGSLWRTSDGYVVDKVTNIGSFTTSGIDVGASYSMELGGIGGLSFSLVGTWLDELTIDNGISETYDCAGYYGPTCGVPSPEWRHKFRVTYTHPSGIGLSAQWRYFSAVDVENKNPSSTLNQAFAPFNETIPSQSYFDLTLTARLGDHYNFRLGVNNILDREPPIIGANGTSTVINACPGTVCSGNTFPNVYDAMGRYIFAGVTLDF